MYTPHPTDPFCYQTFREIPCPLSARVAKIITVHASKYFTAGSNEIKNANQNISKACE